MEVIPDDVGSRDLSGLSTARRNQLRELIRQAIQRLEAVSSGLDPVRVPSVVFDPADPEVVGRLIGDTLLVQPRIALGTLPRFYGSGVYAIYYNGDFPAYAPVKKR